MYEILMYTHSIICLWKKKAQSSIHKYQKFIPDINEQTVASPNENGRNRILQHLCSSIRQSSFHPKNA
ncbi:hypothetical protein Avbf_15126 [Armadillidium vulgare]|nr:hypothetical protein Avbf_15126 [Armadillidium vulgare]